MAHTIPHPPRLRLARPGGTSPPPGPVRRLDARARIGYRELGGPGCGGDGERAAG